MLDLTLQIGGAAHGGWTDINVRRSLEEIAGSFQLGLTERWPEHQEPLVIQPGAACSVKLGATTVITGFIDSSEHQVDARQHSLQLSGRDATADLVDCSAVYAKGEWRNSKIDQIARSLLQPFGISVSTHGDMGHAFPAFALEPGEMVFDALERAARQRGLLLVSDGRGGLVIGRAGAKKVRTALRMGDNLLYAQVRNDNSMRHSQYTVLGQRAGSDQVYGAAAAQVRATATDAGVTRYRPLVLIDEDQGDIAGFQRRAKWEATVRAARALTYTAVVSGWEHADGLWEPNSLVQVYDRVLRVDRELLVREVDYILDPLNGQISQLGLVPVEAYSLLEMPVKKKGPGRKNRRDDEWDPLS